MHTLDAIGATSVARSLALCSYGGSTTTREHAARLHALAPELKPVQAVRALWGLASLAAVTGEVGAALVQRCVAVAAQLDA